MNNLGISKPLAIIIQLPPSYYEIIAPNNCIKDAYYRLYMIYCRHI